MKDWIRRGAFVVAAVVLVLTFVNASWLASAPTGTIRLIAHQGIGQLPVRTATDPCAAAQIEAPVHDFLPDTVRSLDAARRLGADLVEVDLRPTADGHLVAFPDAALDCRTNSKGPVAAQSLAQLQALDPGYGYTPDGGKSFPLRGLRKDKIPSLEDILQALPNTRIRFRLFDPDPAVADRLAAAIDSADRDETGLPDSFAGPDGAVDRLRKRYPAAFAVGDGEADRCTASYRGSGWLGILPSGCRKSALLVSLDSQRGLWGWPNRLLDRFQAAGSRVIVTGPVASQPDRGIDLPEQLTQVPSSFVGYLRVDDFWTIGPALRSDRDFRTDDQAKAAEAQLARRRAAG